MSRSVGRVPMDDPLAYLLTWTAYGTWLPGDQRGWVEKPGRFRAPDMQLQAAARRSMTEAAVVLNAVQRRIVEDTIADHCRIRGWQMHAVSARARHIHAVVAAPGKTPDDVMDQFKSWCTRRLREHMQLHLASGERLREKWWTQRGSKRWLNDEDSLEAAVRYVKDGQGEPTPGTPTTSDASPR